MPWKPSDADRFKKGLNPEEKKRWAAIANNALRECMEVRNDTSACESRAIRMANGSVGGEKDG